MMIYLLIASLAWAAVAAFFVSRLDTFAHRWLSLKETAKPTEAAVIPDDLIALAMGESDKWAQDSVLATIREKWEQYSDWNKVRTALGVGTA